MSDNISIESVNDMCERAGSLTEEDCSEISIDRYSYLLSDPVDLTIKQVLAENPLPFKLQDFQLLVLHCLGSLKNVVLISPTGSGKMICVTLGILVLRNNFGVHKGVGLETQPLR